MLQREPFRPQVCEPFPTMWLNGPILSVPSPCPSVDPLCCFGVFVSVSSKTTLEPHWSCFALEGSRWWDQSSEKPEFCSRMDDATADLGHQGGRTSAFVGQPGQQQGGDVDGLTFLSSTPPHFFSISFYHFSILSGPSEPRGFTMTNSSGRDVRLLHAIGPL